MVCPVCGYRALRVNDTYWCPNDRIYLGRDLATQPSVTATPPTQAPETTYKFPEGKGSKLAKVFNNLVWVVMAILYLVVVVLLAWSYTSGPFSDGSSIF